MRHLVDWELRRLRRLRAESRSYLYSPVRRVTAMIHVVAVLTAHPGKRAEMLEAFQANVPAVKAEAGCIDYTATVDAAGLPPSKGSFGADTFVVIEKWESLAALQAHATAPHMLAYAAATKPLVASRVLHILEPA